MHEWVSTCYANAMLIFYEAIGLSEESKYIVKAKLLGCNTLDTTYSSSTSILNNFKRSPR